MKSTDSRACERARSLMPYELMLHDNGFQTNVIISPYVKREKKPTTVDHNLFPIHVGK